MQGLVNAAKALSATGIWVPDLTGAGSTIPDLSGNGNDLTVAGTITSYRTKATPSPDVKVWTPDYTNVGRAYRATGTNQGSTHTFCVAVNLTSASLRGCFMGMGTVATGGGGTNSGGLSFGVGNATSYENAGNTIDILAEAVAWSNSGTWGTGWMLATMSVSANSCTVYKNDTALRSGVGMSPIYTSASVFFFGGYQSTGTNRTSEAPPVFGAWWVSTALSASDVQGLSRAFLAMGMVGG